MSGDSLVPVPRTWLFAPADSERRLARALRSAAGAVLADLEDAVAPSAKELARKRAVGFASALDAQPGPLRVIRINSPLGELGQRDLESLRSFPRAPLMVPKATEEALDACAGAGFTALVALVETARGVAEVETIAARPDVLALALGTVDLSAELRLLELPGGAELLYVRGRMVLACAAAGIPAIDGVHVHLDDPAELREAASRARALGFAGKLCIHPAQLEAVAGAFLPSAEEVAWARAVLATHARSLAGGAGAAREGREMIDAATARAARAILDEHTRGA
ncbi:MAG: HpcH/HpaI aldolase/citrate lyase family protein [Solirubrobacteraceae bacterium]